MIHNLLVLLLGQDIVAQNYSKDGALQENEDSAASKLDDGDVEGKLVPE